MSWELALPCLRAVLLVVALLAVELPEAVVVGEGVEEAVAVFAAEAVPMVPVSLMRKSIEY